MTHPARWRRPATRLLAAAGAAGGVLLVARAPQVAGRLCPELPPERVWLVRLLGARLVLQHGAVLAAPRRALVRAGSAVELLHAASMVPAAGSARYGRAARISGIVSAASAAVATAVAPAPDPPPRSERR